MLFSSFFFSLITFSDFSFLKKCIFNIKIKNIIIIQFLFLYVKNTKTQKKQKKNIKPNRKDFENKKNIVPNIVI